MTALYRQKYGRWLYRVAPTCRRLYARRTPEHGNATDTQLHEELSRMRITTTTAWLLALGLNVLSPLFRDREIESPRDVLVMEPDELGALLLAVDDFMSNMQGADAALLALDKAQEAPSRPGSRGGRDRDEERTPAMRLQDEVRKLREFLGFDVERGGVRTP